MSHPWRYSEDLNYVRRTAGGVGEILDAIREVAPSVGFDKVQTKVGRNPKARLDSTFVSGTRMRVKIEMNTFERSPAQPVITPEAIAAAFGPYRPEGWTPALALANLEAKLDDARFTTDLDALVAVWPDRYTIEAGGEIARSIIEAVG